MKRVIILLLPVFGCTLDGRISKEDLNKTIECTDARDGETFKFRVSDAEARVGISSQDTVKLTDSEGIERVITEDMDAFLICKESG